MVLQLVFYTPSLVNKNLAGKLGHLACSSLAVACVFPTWKMDKVLSNRKQFLF